MRTRCERRMRNYAVKNVYKRKGMTVCQVRFSRSGWRPQRRLFNKIKATTGRRLNDEDGQPFHLLSLELLASLKGAQTTREKQASYNIRTREQYKQFQLRDGWYLQHFRLRCVYASKNCMLFNNKKITMKCGHC